MHASNAQLNNRLHQVTTYFDTLDTLLAQSGVSLRVRRINQNRVQTLKAACAVGVAADRAEWTINQDEPDLTLIAQTLVGKELPSRMDLAPVIVTDILQTIVVLQLDGGTVIEAAFDQGTIIAGETSEPVCELELELQSDQAAPLYRFALQLYTAIPLTIESKSKAARGYHLQSSTPPNGQKPDYLVLNRKTRTADAFRQIMMAELGHLLMNQLPALAGDVEGVHQMRASIRRLRAA